MQRLPDAPVSPWTPEGEPIFGTFRGECSVVAFEDRVNRIARVRTQKRWLWCGVMNDDIALGLAIVRTGYAANVFCWVYGEPQTEFLADISRVLPVFAVEVAPTPPERGLVARYRAIVEGVEVSRVGQQWRIRGTVGDVHLDLEIDEHGVPMTAICPTATDPPGVNVTRKQVVARAAGTVRVGTERFALQDATALLDHSHGLLPRETNWQWAIGAGTFTDDASPVGFNFVAQFNDGLENAIWLGAEPSAAGHVEFTIPPERGPWRVRGERVDLELVPTQWRAQDLDLGVVVSDYLQPFGAWRGTIDGRSVEARGVAELHRSVW